MKRFLTAVLAIAPLTFVGVSAADARGASYVTYVMAYPVPDACAAVFTGTQNKADAEAAKWQRDGYTTYVYPFGHIPPC